MSRSLFTPPRGVRLETVEMEDGRADTDADLLYEQVYVDKKLLQQRIRQMLRDTNQVRLTEVISSYPLERGLAELVAYVNIGCNEGLVDEDQQDLVTITNRDEITRKVRIPRVLFVR